ncbi:hypothetical protein [Endothiovibrio diazotrophicus]
MTANSGVGSGYDIITTLGSLVGFAFLIAFGYQIYNTVEVDKLRRQSENILKNASKTIEGITSITRAQNEANVRMREAETFLFRANYEFEKRRYELSIAEIMSAISVLEKAKRTLDKKSGMEKIYFSDDQDKPDLDAGKIIDEIHKPVDILLSLSYEQAARSYYKMGDLGHTLDFAKKVIELREDSWAGHHYLGIALLDQRKYESSIPHLKRSIELRPLKNLDYANLAEVSFVSCDFGEALRYSKFYLEQNRGEGSQAFNLINFYKDASQVVLGRADVEKISIHGFQKTKPLGGMISSLREGGVACMVDSKKRGLLEGVFKKIDGFPM